MGETETFGKWLRHRRRDLDLTQEELARQVGCAAITIRKIEADEMRPSKQLAEALVGQLGVPGSERDKYLRFARGEPLAIPSAVAGNHNLPHFVSSFIGRQREISEIKQLMSTSRLMTLTGAGGSGKTRLAIEVASQSFSQFPDGVWLIDFAPLREASLIPQTVASVLGVLEQSGRSPIQVLNDFLRAKTLLLIFDNCEHLAASCAEVANELLQRSQHVHLLLTSREVLGVLGEAQYRVPSLSLPNGSEPLSRETLNQFEAPRLFIERAQSIHPAFDVNAANSEAIAQICLRLDGIPLAIELAAARVKTLTVEHIAERLDDRFNLLTTGNRSALPRHQTLRATLDWSYELLTEEQRILLRRLSVFRGGWTLDAAENICASENHCIGNVGVFELSTRLADQSLLTVEHRAEGERYSLLETVREYAKEKLIESGEEEQIRKAQLNFYVGLAEEAELNYRGREQKRWLRLMENERDNFRSCMDYALRSSPNELAPRLIGAAFWLWFFRGPWREGQSWTEAALTHNSDGHTAANAKLLMALGLLNFAQSDYSASKTALDKSLAIWREVDNKWWCAFVLGFMALPMRVYDQETASALFRESLFMAKQTNDNWIMAYSMWNSGENELNRQNLPEAQALLEESLQLCDIVEDKLVKHEVLRTLGELAETKLEYRHAVALYQQSQAIIEELDTPSISMLHLELGRVLQLTGDNNLAARHFAEEIIWSRQAGNQASLLRALQGLGAVAAARGQAYRAVCLFAAAEALFSGLGYSFAFNLNETAWLERHLRIAQAELGEAQFSSAEIKGRSMNLDQAVEFALEGV